MIELPTIIYKHRCTVFREYNMYRPLMRYRNVKATDSALGYFVASAMHMYSILICK